MGIVILVLVFLGLSVLLPRLPEPLRSYIAGQDPPSGDGDSSGDRIAPEPWYARPESIAQMAHFFGGVSFTFLACSLLHWPWWAGFVATLGWAAPKEFVVDVFGPEKDSWRGSAIDFGSYLAGAAAASVLFLIYG